LNWRYFLLSHQCRGLVQLEVGEVISSGDRGGIQHRCADRTRRVACADGHACCADQRFLEKDSSRVRRIEGRVAVWFEDCSHVTSSHSPVQSQSQRFALGRYRFRILTGPKALIFRRGGQRGTRPAGSKGGTRRRTWTNRGELDDTVEESSLSHPSRGWPPLAYLF